MLQRLLNMLSPRARAEGVAISPYARDEALDILDSNGIDAHFYLPSVGSRDNPELSEALEFLGYKGYIFTRSDGSLVGKVAKARLSADEKASQRRASFKVI